MLVLEDAARGKGRAVRTGFERATGDIVMVQDADLELEPGEIPSLLAPIVDGQTDVVFGSRFRARARGTTPLGRLHRQLRADVGGQRPLLRRA